jgi:hypothetical protein
MEPAWADERRRVDLYEAHVEVRRLLDSSLDELTGAGRLGVRPPVERESWDLPEPDCDALWRYGLPPARDDELMGVVGRFQAGREPELEEDGARLYLLGMFGVARLAAVQGTGTVIAIPAFRSVHPQLLYLYPDGIVPQTANSSVAHLVDLAWRWHWLLPVLVDQQVQAAKGEAAAVDVLRATGILPDIFAGVRKLHRDVLERFRSTDPEAVTGDDSFWGESVLEDL